MGKDVKRQIKLNEKAQQDGYTITGQPIKSNSFYDLFKGVGHARPLVDYSFTATLRQPNDWVGLNLAESKVLDNASLVELLNLHEMERKRISRELHDGLGQLLTNINLRIQHCVTQIKDAGGQEVLGNSLSSLESIPGLVAEAMGEVRNICSALRPAILDDLGVLAAISWQCRQCREAVSGLDTEVGFALKESDIPEEYKTAIYRITQEALNNVVKYSGANKISLNMKKDQGSITLSVFDNGKGFDIEDTKSDPHNPDPCGNGLRNMRERVEILGGRITVESQENLGTRIQVSFPVNQ